MKKVLVVLIGIALAAAIGHYIYKQMNSHAGHDVNGESMSSSSAMMEASSSSAAAMMKGEVKMQVEDAE